MYVMYVMYVIALPNVQGKAMPCPVFFRSSGRVLPPLAAPALPEPVVFGVLVM
jgi:hypothetical protein